jgi:hypothetical protein
MAAFFVPLSPGVLARLFKNCSKFLVIATCVVIFWLIYTFMRGVEGFQTTGSVAGSRAVLSESESKSIGSGVRDNPCEYGSQCFTGVCIDKICK